MKRSIKLIGIPALCVLGLSACNREEGINFRIEEPQAIIITVSDINGIISKAEDSVENGAVLFEDLFLAEISEEDSLLISAYVEDNINLPFDLEQELTKGSVMTGDSLKKKSFVMNGWLGSENRYQNDKEGRTYEAGGSTGRVNFEADETDYHFIKNASVSYSSDKWSLNQQAIWRNNVPSTFWSHYPSSLANITWPGNTASDADQGKLSFTYSLPVPSTDDATDAAVKTQDVLFAYNYQRASFGIDPDNKETYGKLVNGTSDMVDIHFYHTMAAVRFDISRLVAAGVTVTEIFLQNVVKEGSCSINGNGTNGVTIAWTPDYTKKSGRLTQAFAGTDFKGKGLVKEDYVSNPDNALQTNGDKFFFFIPQEVTGKDIKIGLKYTNSLGVAATAMTTLSHVPWEAGKLYTYKLSTTADKIDVAVEDEVEEFDKTDLAITNTGTAVEYIRALLIGAYCETDYDAKKQTADKGAIVYSWNPDDPDLGTFDGYPGTDWVKGSDGFWYYTQPVDPTNTTSQLFEAYHSYFMPPVGNSHLEINIAAQAVAYDKDKSIVTEAWGVDNIKLATDPTRTVKDALKTRE